MKHKIDVSYLGVELVDGKVKLTTYVDEAFDNDRDFLIKLVEDFIDYETVDVSFEQTINLSEILDSFITNNELMSEEIHTVDIETKPVFDKIREELQALIAKIDSLAYAKGDYPNNFDGVKS